VSDPVYELGGQLTMEDLLRYQYFHAFRKSWPILLVLALIQLIGIVARHDSPYCLGTIKRHITAELHSWLYSSSSGALYSFAHIWAPKS